MPLVKSTLKTELQSLFQTAYDEGKTLEWVAENMATAIDNYIKTATVTVTAVTVTTACGAGPGTGTGSGSGSLS